MCLETGAVFGENSFGTTKDKAIKKGMQAGNQRSMECCSEGKLARAVPGKAIPCSSSSTPLNLPHKSCVRRVLK